MDIIFQFEKPNVVIHAAAESAVDKSLTDPNSFVSSNVLGTQVIINCCLKYGVKKLIYVSSDEVYGQLTNEQEVSWTEDDVPNPRNPYSASKYCGEILIKAAHQSHGLTYNITRSSNNYGPRQMPDKLIPRAIKCILEGKKIPIYGQGQQIRDWTFVGDNCSAIMTVLEKGTPNEVYNISANQEFSNLEVVHEICKYMGKSADAIEFIPDPRGNGHDFRYSVNSSKIRELGWKPTMQFKKDLGTCCIDWFLQNKFWFNQS
jgi:dTDP-glucose 4,6-dehydratase